MNQIIMTLMAIGAVLGGLDRCLGFTLGVEPEMVLPLLASKLLGAVMALAVALWLTGAKRFTL